MQAQSAAKVLAAVHGCRTRFAAQCRKSNSHLRCSNSDCAHAVHLHHFAGHDMQRLRKMQYFALHPETAHHFPACIHLPPLALQNVNLRCAAEFHAQARQENGDGILLTAKLDRKFLPFSPQRADEIPRKAAESDCSGQSRQMQECAQRKWAEMPAAATRTNARTFWQRTETLAARLRTSAARRG